MRYILIYISIIVSSYSGLSQDCSFPITLCSNAPESIDSSFFSGPFVGSCFTSTESIFYEFTTNNNLTNTSAFLPYNVQVAISIMNCVDAGIPMLVTAGIYEASSLPNPCLGLTEIAACATSSSSILLNSGVLNPNSTYYVVLGIDPASVGFACDIDVSISGAPLEINACCDATIAPGESSNPQVFGATTIFGVENYTWSPPETLDDFQSDSPIATPSFTTTYDVTALVGDCLASDEITITVSAADEIINPYDIFTPNGDGTNDTWKIRGIDKFDNPLVNIYDRWGQQVFQSLGYDKPWDGTNEGNRLTTGSYYYVIEVNTQNGIEHVIGYVTLLN